MTDDATSAALFAHIGHIQDDGSVPPSSAHSHGDTTAVDSAIEPGKRHHPMTLLYDALRTAARENVDSDIVRGRIKDAFKELSALPLVPVRVDGCQLHDARGQVLAVANTPALAEVLCAVLNGIAPLLVALATIEHDVLTMAQQVSELAPNPDRLVEKQSASSPKNTATPPSQNPNSAEVLFQRLREKNAT